MKIVVAASVAAVARQAGWTWAVLQYLLGFRKLGHDVWFLDPLDSAAVRASGGSLEESVYADAFVTFVDSIGMAGVSTLFVNGERKTVGHTPEALEAIVRDADVLFNVSGKLRDAELVGAAARAVYVDVDPAFTQLWQAVQGIDMGLDGHTHFVTIGHNIGHASGNIPSLGRSWISTLPPVLLDAWPVASHVEWNALTTVANWRGYGSITHDGIVFGQKAHALRELIGLPCKTTECFLLALAIDPGEQRDLDALAAYRWRLIDPLSVASTPDDYRAFVRGSKAEFAVAKSGYVAAQSGWFSDRSVCYLASGRPVIAHDTGFSAFLPTGTGLFRFRTEDDVLASIDALNADYARHARGARELAEAYFDSRHVLTRLLEQVGAS